MSRSVALAALYGALGLGQALQNTQHVAWSVPRNSRPNPVYARVKTLVLLVTAGFSLLAVSVVSTVASTTDVFTEVVGDGLKVLLPVLTIAVVGTFLTLLFRYAATGQHSFRRAAPGGFALAVMWQVLQYAGAAYVDRVLVDTTSMTKTFGLVLGLIGFLWIGAVMAVLAMEINVVLARRLWPRALLTPFTDNVELTEADRRAYASYARMQRHKGFEKVSVVWERGPAEVDVPEDPGARRRRGPRGPGPARGEPVAVDVDPPARALLEAAHLVHPPGLRGRHELDRVALGGDDPQPGPPGGRVEGDVVGTRARVPGAEQVVGVAPHVRGVARPHQLLRRGRLRGVGQQRPAARVVRRSGSARAGRLERRHGPQRRAGTDPLEMLVVRV